LWWTKNSASLIVAYTGGRGRGGGMALLPTRLRAHDSGGAGREAPPPRGGSRTGKKDPLRRLSTGHPEGRALRRGSFGNRRASRKWTGNRPLTGRPRSAGFQPGFSGRNGPQSGLANSSCSRAAAAGLVPVRRISLPRRGDGQAPHGVRSSPDQRDASSFRAPAGGPAHSTPPQGAQRRGARWGGAAVIAAEEGRDSDSDPGGFEHDLPDPGSRSSGGEPNPRKGAGRWRAERENATGRSAIADEESVPASDASPLPIGGKLGGPYLIRPGAVAEKKTRSEGGGFGTNTDHSRPTEFENHGGGSFMAKTPRKVNKFGNLLRLFWGGLEARGRWG